MHIIKTTREFHEVYNSCERKHGSLFVFLISRSEPEDQAAGIVVSKKVGNAVKRNRVKRRIRAYIREHPDDLPQGKLVIIAKQESGTSTWAEIEEDLKKNLRALNSG